MQGRTVSRRLSRQLALLSLFLGTAAFAQTGSNLYFWNPQGDNGTPVLNTGELFILSLSAQTTWKLTDLTAGTTVTSGTLGTVATPNQQATVATGNGMGQMPQGHNFKLTSSARVNAFFGGDCCTNWGNFQVPSDEDASRRVGSSFTFWAPVIDANTQTWVFSRSAGTVQVTNAAGTVVAGPQTFTGSKQMWQIPNAALTAQTFFSIASTDGLLFSVEQSVVNGAATIPAADGWDVGPYGLFAVVANFNGAFALFGYDKAGTTYNIHDVAANPYPDVNGTLTFGQSFYQDGNAQGRNYNDHQFVVTTTSGKLAIWAGDDQNDQGQKHPPNPAETCAASDGVNGVYQTIACMGDDITFDSGDLSVSGTTVIVNPRTLGGKVFVPASGTLLSISDINGNPILMPTTTSLADQVFSIPEVTSAATNVNVIVTANQPVIVQTTGGDQMDDWGKYLIEVPAPGLSPAAPVITGPATSSTLTFTLTGTAPDNSTVTVFDSSGNVLGSVAASSSGAWTLPVTETTYSTTYAFTANDAVDGVGSPPSATFNVQVGPPPPTVGSPSAGAVACSDTVAFAGSGVPGDSISVSVDGNVFAGTVDPDAGWQVSATVAAEGTYTAAVTETAAGVASTADDVTFSVETSISATSFTVPTATGQVYVTTSPLLSGDAQPDATVVITVVDSSSVQEGTKTVSASDAGTWSAQPALSPGANGTYTVTAAATSDDVCAYSSQATISITLDTTPATLTSPDAGITVTQQDVTLIGTGAQGTDVVVILNSGTPVDVPVAANGSWTLPIVLTPGVNTVTFFDQDATGGQSAPTTDNFTFSTAATVISTPTSGAQLGSGQVTVTGTAPADTTIDLLLVGDGGTDAGFAVVSVDNGGNWSLPTTLADDDYTATATDIDGIGDQGTPASVGFTVDSSAPALSITDPADGSVTSNPSPTVDGQGQSNASISLVLTNSAGAVVFTGATTVAPGGAWNVPIGMTLANDTYTATVTETDAAGKQAVASTTFTVATALPQTPTITAPQGVTNDNKPTITGTAAPSSTITVTLTGAGVNLTFTVSVDANGNWSQPVGQTLGDGPYSITATATNADGNTASVTDNFTVDTQTPAAPVIVSPANGSTTTPTPGFAGTAPANSTVTLTVTDSTSTVTTVVTTADASGNWSANLPAGDTLATGAATVSATDEDLAGNISSPSATTNFTVSSGAPTPPVVTEPTSGSITNDTDPGVAGSAPPGSTVTVTITGPGGFTETDTTAAFADGGFDVPDAGALTGGDGTYAVTATDTTGSGTSQPSQPVSFTLDTTPPAPPTIINPPSGSVQATTQPLISGTAEPGSTVTVTVNGVVEGTVQADSNGNWSFAPTSPLPSGPNTVSATATDAAGNVSQPTSDTFTVTLSAPQPTITSPSNGADLPSTTPTIAGTASPGATVTVLIDGVAAGTTVADSSGNWTFVPTTALSQGAHQVQVTENVSNAVPSNVVAFDVDTVAPNAPVITSPSNGQTEVVNQPFTVTGTGEPGAVVELSANGVLVATPTVGANGQWSAQVDPTATGSLDLVATQTDGAGNTSLPSSVVQVSVVPAAPVINAPSAGATETGGQAFTVSGSAPPNSSVTVFADGVSVGTATADGSGSWSTSVTLSSLGTTTLTATDTVGGETSQASTGVVITVIASGSSGSTSTASSGSTGRSSNASSISASSVSGSSASTASGSSGTSGSLGSTSSVAGSTSATTASTTAASTSASGSTAGSTSASTGASLGTSGSRASTTAASGSSRATSASTAASTGSKGASSGVAGSSGSTGALSGSAVSSASSSSGGSRSTTSSKGATSGTSGSVGASASGSNSTARSTGASGSAGSASGASASSGTSGSTVVSGASAGSNSGSTSGRSSGASGASLSGSSGSGSRASGSGASSGSITGTTIGQSIGASSGASSGTASGSTSGGSSGSKTSSLGSSSSAKTSSATSTSGSGGSSSSGPLPAYSVGGGGCHCGNVGDGGWWLVIPTLLTWRRRRRQA